MAENDNEAIGDAGFSQDEIDRRMELFQGMVQCCHPVRFWTYEISDAEIRCLTPNPEGDLEEYMFHYSKAFRALQEMIDRGERCACILTNEVSLQWIGDFFQDRLYLIGPIYLNDASPVQVRRTMDRENQQVNVRIRMEKALRRIPAIASIDIYQYAIMLHYALTGEQLKIADIRRPHVTDKNEYESRSAADDAEEKDETAAVHVGAQRADTLLLEAVRTGNLNYQKALDYASVISSGVRSTGKDSLRTGKNSIIAFVALCSRAAIDGGLPAEISYTLCDRYIDMVEDCGDLGEAASLSRAMMNDYVQRVHDYRNSLGFSRPVMICLDYIEMNLTRPIGLDELAKICGYTRYYLSRRFRQETGMTIAQTIQKKRIEASARMLCTTELPIQEIARHFQFSDTSYYTSLFQRYMKTTPAAYRQEKRTAAPEEKQR